MFRRELKRPPRIAVMTDTAWKSGTLRGSPGWPIRISVWTAPGRWITRTSRASRAAAPLDLDLGERGPSRHLRHELECGLEARRGDVDARGGRVPAGLGVQRGAQPLGGLDEPDRVEALRSLGQRPRGEHRRTGILG